MTEDGLGRFQPLIIPNHLCLGMPQLVRVPVDEPRRPKPADSIGLVNSRCRLLGNPVTHRQVLGVSRVVVTNVLEVRLRFAILVRLVGSIPLGH